MNAVVTSRRWFFGVVLSLALHGGVRAASPGSRPEPTLPAVERDLLKAYDETLAKYQRACLDHDPAAQAEQFARKDALLDMLVAIRPPSPIPPKVELIVFQKFEGNELYADPIVWWLNRESAEAVKKLNPQKGQVLGIVTREVPDRLSPRTLRYRLEREWFLLGDSLPIDAGRE